MGKKSRRGVRRHRRIPLTPEIEEGLRRVKGEFVRKFGREPEPEDPMLFDPDTSSPTPLEAEKMLAIFHKIGIEIGIDPALLYAVRCTGLIVSEDNVHLHSEEELEEWVAAVEEGRKLLQTQGPYN